MAAIKNQLNATAAKRTVEYRRRASERSKAQWNAMSESQRAARTATLDHGQRADIAEKRRKGVISSWSKLTPEERAARVEAAAAARRGRVSDAHMRQLKRLHSVRTQRQRTVQPAAMTAARRKQLAAMTPDERREQAMPAVIASRRRHPTNIEIAVETLLLELGIDFVAQHRIGRYVVDFHVPSRRLVIECDGEYWHSLPEAVEKDARRDLYLANCGYRVIRLKEREIGALTTDALKRKFA